MAEDAGQSEGENAREHDIVTATIEPDPTSAEYDLLEVLSGLDGREMDEFPSLYDHVDHLVEAMFDTPPAPEAQVEVSFSYAGYRITLDQSGQVRIVDVRETLQEP